MATIEDYKKIEIRAGKIISAERVLNSEKLVKLSVSFGEFGTRQIIAGVAPYFHDVNILVGRICAFAFNLEPRVLMGLESQGMILAAGEAGAFSLLYIDQSVAPGSAVH